MKKSLYILFTTIILCSCSTQKIIDYNKVYGLWEFPDTMVWIEIKPNNQVFQCRISPFDKVYKSRGHLKGNKIIWEEIWGSDKIKISKDSLVLKGKYGTFSYIKSLGKMNKKCFE